MDHHPPLQRLLAHSTMHSSTQSALIAASVLLALTWLTAWVLHWRQPVVLMASLAIVVLAFAFALVSARLTTRHRERHGEIDAQRSGSHTADGTIDTRQGSTASVRSKRWSLEVFANIDAQRFAAVCETWFSWAGFDTRRECHRTELGVDIWLHQPRLSKPVAIVRCKHAYGRPVGVQELREFQDIVLHCQNAHGTFTTTSTYTPEALQFAKENGIELVDGRDLLRRILTRTRRSQQALLAVAYHGR